MFPAVLLFLHFCRLHFYVMAHTLILFLIQDLLPTSRICKQPEFANNKQFVSQSCTTFHVIKS